MPLRNSSPKAGIFPFTHGIYPEMYTKQLWTMRQYAGFGNAAASNARYRYLLARGVTGLSVAVDLPTQLGLDADDPRAAGEVGRTGVSISSLADMEQLFADIPLNRVSTSITINATAAVLLACYIAAAQGRGIAAAQLAGTVQNDLFKEFIARGNYIYPVEASLRLTTDIIEYCSTTLPRWNPISISGYHMREAGCTAAQEVGFTLAHGLAYVQAAVDRGLDVNAFGRRLSFFFNAHNDFFEEIAKFRAARTLWAHLMRQRFRTDDVACRLRFHTQTGGSTLTAQQVDNNIVRVAYQAMAAVLGGTQSLHTNSKDEALALPTEAAAQTALRTQQVLAYESGVTKYSDPLAGSHVVEALTERILQEASAYIEKIDQLGGAAHALSAGYQQREIQDAAYRDQQAIDRGTRTIVGVNAFTNDDVTPPEIHTVDPQSESAQRAALAVLRKTRRTSDVTTALERLAQAAHGTENLLPHMVQAVHCYATLGEISTALRQVFGEYREQTSL